MVEVNDDIYTSHQLDKAAEESNNNNFTSPNADVTDNADDEDNASTSSETVDVTVSDFSKEKVLTLDNTELESVVKRGFKPSKISTTKA